MAKSVVSDLDFGGTARITSLPNPATAQEPATRQYVDNAVEGLAWKDSVRVATQANLSVASPGSTIDGITMVANDRVLVRSQTLPAENGIYIWNGSAIPMTRSADASTFDELEQAIATVEEGTSTAATYRQSSVNFVLNTGAVNWVAFGTSAGAASESTSGIAEIATQVETDAGTDDVRMITPLKLKTYSGAFKRYSTDIGDGSATSYTVTHNLNTRDVEVQVRRNSGNYDEVLVDIQRTSVNTCTVVFSTAPTSNQFRVTVQA